MTRRGPTVRQRVAALIQERPGLDVKEIRAALPDASASSIEYALWELVRTQEVRRTPGGQPRAGVRYTYTSELEDDGWRPQPWRHPYARPRVTASAGGRS